ncbi:hypothetical protein M2171_002022 [Bradyrhizobium japonicum USDA 38]|uniref:hypothetical protein n=1 Tax=Bradyrhizobium japonicum TaxID=375 RepID=UPI0004886B1B|nr:hypothetical protein [Bradyrhizobium japonicum]MCS3892889.1 hypothetical protein [Bradyrhizobium japonicum USDA 38]MCS3945402.1 hypothetical protein [Bradyrhizobium japonicum]MCW2222072.1 hypothetical protein [Bradyrhizobium japonicum]MCW2346684.1 hypothetical protein [Bradyrhizobium japonicum]
MSQTFVSRSDVERAKQANPWNLTNSVLYKLCSDHPTHMERDAVLAKINIIGRVYAAAIERRKVVLPDETNESFYISSVAPAVMESSLDDWINRAKSVDPDGPTALSVMLEVHKLTTELFNQISGLNKRSLASKYLHFHVPHLFFIFDSRAQTGIGSLSLPKLIERSRPRRHDRVYAAFAERCVALRSHCESRFGVKLTPRELDNLVLGVDPQIGRR